MRVGIEMQFRIETKMSYPGNALKPVSIIFKKCGIRVSQLFELLLSIKFYLALNHTFQYFSKVS